MELAGRGEQHGQLVGANVHRDNALWDVSGSGGRRSAKCEGRRRRSKRLTETSTQHAQNVPLTPKKPVMPCVLYPRISSYFVSNRFSILAKASTCSLKR